MHLVHFQQLLGNTLSLFPCMPTLPDRFILCGLYMYSANEENKSR